MRKLKSGYKAKDGNEFVTKTELRHYQHKLRAILLTRKILAHELAKSDKYAALANETMITLMADLLINTTTLELCTFPKAGLRKEQKRVAKIQQNRFRKRH